MTTLHARTWLSRALCAPGQRCWKTKKVHETITFFVLTLPNIIRFKKIHSHTQKKPFFIWLLTTPQHMKYAATLPCNLLSMACFADSNVSQGSVAAYVRCGGICNIHLTANLPRNLPANFLKSVKIWQNYRHESVAPLFGPPCIACTSYTTLQFF